jgi:DUF177 domain-containing protein
MVYFGVRYRGFAVSDRSLLPTQIDLRPLPEAERALDRDFTPEQVMEHAAGTGSRPDSGTGVPSDDDFGVVGPIRFRGTLARTGDRFLLRGRITATLQLACGRCLKPFTQAVDTEVDLTYVPRVAAGPAAKDAKGRAADTEVELQDEDLSTAYYDDHLLDLGEMIREQFYLALPMRPLCRADCPGLCPHCGADRSLEQCQCHEEWVDPRLAALKAIVTRKPE